jgi:hypothetical protein
MNEEIVSALNCPLRLQRFDRPVLLTCDHALCAMCVVETAKKMVSEKTMGSSEAFVLAQIIP